MSYCTGRGTLDGDHCCYVNGEVCDYLERGTVAGRTFACGLRRELGSWDAVHEDERYQPIQAVWDAGGVITSCGGWQPEPNNCCREI